MHNVKRISSHGSVSIPVAIRRSMGIREQDAMDVSTDERGRIILEPHVDRCIICGSTERTALVSGRRICEGCCWKALETLERRKE